MNNFTLRSFSCHLISFLCLFLVLVCFQLFLKYFSSKDTWKDTLTKEINSYKN